MYPDAQEKTAYEFWVLLYRKRLLLLLVALASMTTAALTGRLLPNVYEANIQFFVPASPDTVSYLSNPGTLSRGPVVPTAAEEFHSPYIGILKSRSLREMIRGEFPGRTLASLKRDVSFSLSSEYIMNIYVRDKDPALAAGIANSYVKNLNMLLGRYSLETSQRTRTLLEEEIGEVRRLLMNKRVEMKGLRERQRFVSLEAETGQLIASRSDFQTRLNNTVIQEKENEVRMEALGGEIAKESALLPSSVIAYSTPLLEDLEKRLASNELEMAAMKLDYREDHPDFAVLKKQNEEIRNSIDSEIRRLVGSRIQLPGSFYEKMRQELSGLLVDQQRIQAGKKAYQAILERIDSRLQQLSDLHLRVDSLELDIARHTAILKDLENRLEESRLQGKTPIRSVVVLANATPPERPIYPNLSLNLLVAGLAGLLGGILYVFFLDYIEQSKQTRLIALVKEIEAGTR